MRRRRSSRPIWSPIRAFVANRVGEAVSSRPDWWPIGSVLFLALLLGGGTHQGLWSDAIVQIASLPLLWIAVVEVRRGEWNRQGRMALLLMAAVLLLPLIQLVPLPPAVWTALPGRSAFADAYAQAEIPTPWLGISLNPAATWRSALSLLPPIAVFLSALTLGRHSRRALTLGLIAFGFVSVVLGLAQLTQGPESALRFYDPTNPTEAVGFFANRNHFASLLCIILPFTAAWAVGLAADRRPAMLVGLALCILVLATLLLGLGMARSRAGLALAMLAGVGSLALGWTGHDTMAGQRGSRILFFAAFVGLVLVVQFALGGILQRLETDVTDDIRWQLTRVTWQFAQTFQPFGSGFGTFEPIYRIHETVDRLQPLYANHAHDDYVEILLEGGWLAIALVLGFFAWLVSGSAHVWRRPKWAATSAIDLLLPRAAMLAVVLLVLHSAVDYPLRTTALSTLFAFSCALMISPFRVSDDRSRNGQRSGRNPAGR